MINNISTTSFSSGIYFIPKKELRQLAYTSYESRRSYFTTTKPYVKEIFEGGIDTVKTLKDQDKGFTEGLIYCLGGLLKEGKNKLMFHFYPPDFIADMPVIKKKVQDININGNLKGLIIGGSYFPGKDLSTCSDQSLEIFSNLKKVFKKFKNKDFTIFYGQKNTNSSLNKETDFLYDNINDNYFISINTDEITPENIKNHYKFIRISPNDEVFIEGKKISSKLLET